jgi:hypothetical protein
VLVIHVSRTHRILVGVETAEIKAGIGIAHRHCKSWSGSVVLEIIDEINVVCSEVGIAEWRVCRYGVT